jgi:hypothetical protein
MRLSSMPGYYLDSIAAIELLSHNAATPAPADADEIALVSGLTLDPVDGNPGFTVSPARCPRRRLHDRRA